MHSRDSPGCTLDSYRSTEVVKLDTTTVTFVGGRGTVTGGNALEASLLQALHPVELHALTLPKTVPPGGTEKDRELVTTPAARSIGTIVVLSGIVAVDSTSCTFVNRVGFPLVSVRGKIHENVTVLVTVCARAIPKAQTPRRAKASVMASFCFIVILHRYVRENNDYHQAD